MKSKHSKSQKNNQNKNNTHSKMNDNKQITEHWRFGKEQGTFTATNFRFALTKRSNCRRINWIFSSCLNFVSCCFGFDWLEFFVLQFDIHRFCFLILIYLFWSVEMITRCNASNRSRILSQNSTIWARKMKGNKLKQQLSWQLFWEVMTMKQ